MTAVAQNNYLTGLWFVKQKYYPANSNTWTYDPDQSIFKELGEWLNCYFQGKYNIVLPKINPQGTPFQMMVWDLLLQIPCGSVTTYGEIAQKVATNRDLQSMSAQAVGGAVGHNTISILIPCHRVIGANGSLTGYGGGLDRKKALLNLERADLSHRQIFKF